MLSHTDLKYRQVILLNTFENSYHLCVSQGNIVIKNHDDKILTKVSRHQAFAIMVIGHCTITSVVIDHCQKNGIALVLLNARLRPILFANNAGEANFLLRQKQYQLDDISNLTIAKCLIKHKIYHQTQQLKTIRQKDDELKQAIDKLTDYQTQSQSVTRLDELMGVEGNSAKLYFKHHFGQLKQTTWQGRKPRLKLDPVNVVLDMGYTLLFNYIEANLRLFGFDVYKGTLHQLWFKRKSLVCDLVEPFRCIIDKQVLVAFNLGQFKAEHFSQIKQQYRLDNKHAKEYNAILMKAIIDYKLEIFIYIRDFYRAFMKFDSSNLAFDIASFDKIALPTQEYDDDYCEL